MSWVLNSITIEKRGMKCKANRNELYDFHQLKEAEGDEVEQNELK